tara:strand:- start:80 stop:658 length:579 start_codon:yes stop_codon:yes gene_type:complete
MITQRFRNNPNWTTIKTNHQFMGMINLISFLSENLDEDEDRQMIEIGSYMGESTFLFACSNIFSNIETIEPHDGEEEFNNIFDYDWDFVKKEFETNIRFFDNIKHHKDYSYNVVDKFNNRNYDFVYVDGNHDYFSVERDLLSYSSKVKIGGFIGGHDYLPSEWPEVVRAIHNVVGKPDHVYWDSSWIKKIRS